MTDEKKEREKMKRLVMSQLLQCVTALNTFGDFLSLHEYNEDIYPLVKSLSKYIGIK